MTLKEFKAWYWSHFSDPSNLTEENVKQLSLNRDYLKRGFNLYPFQVPAAYVLANFNQVLYTDDMGLGKTPTMIAALSDMYSKGYRKFIICVLFATMGQWEDSIHKFSTFQTLRVRGGKQQRYQMYETFMQDEDEDILLVSYNTMLTDYEVIQQLKYSTLIFDECDYFKSPTSVIYKAVSKVRKKASKCILITATPVTGKLEDSFNCVDILTSGSMSYYRLRDTFCEMQQLKTPVYDKRTGRKREVKVWTIKKYREVDKFKELFETFTFGRTTEQTGTRMPHMNVYFDYIDKTDALKRYEKLTLGGTFVKSKEEQFKLNGLQKVSYLARGFHSLKMLYSETNVANPKKDRLIQLLKTFGEDEQVAIFSNYKQLPSELKDYLDENGGVAFITGDVTGNSRLNQLKDFQQKKLKYVVLTLAGYAGISLPSCRHMICIDQVYNAARMRQVQGRICRKDSVSDEVDVTYIMYRDSIDTLTRELLDSRYKLIDFMGSPDEADETLLKALEKAAGIGVKKLG